MLALLLGIVSARAETPALLGQAVQRLAADQDHWAYTQTTQRYGRDGRPKAGATVEQYDPSKPYDLQWKLVRYKGRMPDDSEVVAWRRRKEAEMKRHDEETIGNLVDLEHAALASETGVAALFRAPLWQSAAKRVASDQFEVLMQVDKASQVLTAFSVQPRTAARLEVGSLRMDGRLEVVQPNYAPTLVSLKGDRTARLFGLDVARSQEITYRDFHRVLPYSARFQVTLGDARMARL